MVNHNTFLSRFTRHLFQRGFFLLQEKFRRTSTFLCIKPARTTNLRRMHCPGKKSSLPVFTFCWLPLVVVSLKVESFDSCARERKCRFCKLTVCCWELDSQWFLRTWEYEKGEKATLKSVKRYRLTSKFSKRPTNPHNWRCHSDLRHWAAKHTAMYHSNLLSGGTTQSRESALSVILMISY